MANAVTFRRTLCRAAETIGFESQVGLYFMQDALVDGAALELRKVGTGNVGLVDGMLSVDFYLNDNQFAEPEEVVVGSLLTNGVQAVGNIEGGAALHITGVILTRNWPPDVP